MTGREYKYRKVANAKKWLSHEEKKIITAQNKGFEDMIFGGSPTRLSFFGFKCNGTVNQIPTTITV